MPKFTKPDSTLPRTAKTMRSNGATVGKIARRLGISLEDANRLVRGNNYRDKLRLFPSGERIPSKQQETTAAAFVRWLSLVLKHLEQMTQWPVRTTPFTYFNSIAWWKIGPGVTVEAIPFEYEAAHERGDNEAIYQFAKENREALLKDWVVRELVGWRLAGDKKKFDKSMRAYWTTHGQRDRETTLTLIRLHQSIYRDYLTGNFSYKALVDKHGYGIDTIKKVLNHYRAASKRWSKLARLPKIIALK